MAENAVRVMNAAPDNLELTVKDDGTFVLTFEQYVVTAEGARFTKRVRLHLKDWWLPVIVRELRDVALKRQEHAKRLLAAFVQT